MDKSGVESAIKTFAEGADAQNSEQVLSVLHKDALQFFMGKEGLTKLTTDMYKGMLDSKKIGGKPRQMTIHSVDIEGNIATAKVTFDGGHATFDNFISLMNVDGGWKIMNIVLRYKPKG